MFSIRVKNSVDPDKKPADLDLRCFQKMINAGSKGQGLTCVFLFCRTDMFIHAEDFKTNETLAAAELLR